MKLKYYLRGLGIGIAVTVLVVGLSSGRKSMTDEEVIARAKELGMVESMVLSNMNSRQEQPDVSTNEQEETKPIEEETKPIEEETKPIEEEKKPIEIEAEKENFVFTVFPGESSVTVSKALKEAGLVEDASAYDRFLCENGYDRKIRVGTYDIPADADQEEIARIITGADR